MQKIEYISVDSIINHPNNPRIIKDEKFRQLCDSIKGNKDFFETRPILCNKQMVVFAGNMRLNAARDIGMKEVPTAVMDISEARQREIMIRDNINQGEWQWDVLANNFQIEELINLGFEKADLNFFENKEDDFNEEEELAKITVPKVKTGEVYVLGDHRLMCGDSTKEDDFNILFVNGEKARLIFTDPPYNVDYKSSAGNSYSLGKYGGAKIFNDNKSDEDCLTFYVDVLKNLYSFSTEDVSIYWWLGFNSNAIVNLLAFKETSWKMSQMIIWVKESMIFSLGQDYHRLHEACFMGWKKDHKHFLNKGYATFKDVFTLDRESFDELPDIWYEKRDNTKDYIHPTQKPVRLAERALKKNSQHGDIVVDAFGGSGSTLMACEQSGRKARLCEMDPKYVHAILNRWAKYTGKDPVREDGVAWSEISK